LGSFFALFRSLLLILKDIPASVGFVLQIFIGGEGYGNAVPHGRPGATPLDPLVSGLVMSETIEEPQPCLELSFTPFQEQTSIVRSV